MAKQAANSIRIYVDEFNFSGDLTSASMEVTPEIAKAEAFSTVGPARVMGSYDATQSHLGLFEPGTGANEYDEEVFAMLLDGADHYVGQFFAGTTAGNVAYEHVAKLSGNPRSAQRGDVVMAHFDTVGSGGTTRGIVLGAKTSTGTENLTGINQGTTTSPEQYTVVFRLIAFTGTNITMTIEQSSDNGGGDAYATISGVTSGSLTSPGVVQASTTATTEAWKRVALTGTYSSAEILVTGGTLAGT